MDSQNKLNQRTWVQETLKIHSKIARKIPLKDQVVSQQVSQKETQT
jgi:hypothetical protein